MDLSYIQRPNPHEGVISVCKFPFACIWGFSAWLSPFIRSHQDGAIFIPEGLVYHEPFNFIVFGNSIYVNYGVGFGPFSSPSLPLSLFPPPHFDSFIGGLPD